MNKLKIAFNYYDSCLHSARLREKTTMTSRMVYRIGSTRWDVKEALRKEFGKKYFITEVCKMSPAQVIRAAEKHLPNRNIL
jgi:hypothetical protein